MCSSPCLSMVLLSPALLALSVTNAVPLLNSSRKDATISEAPNKPQREVRSSKVEPVLPATQECFVFRWTSGLQAAYPVSHHSGRPQPHTIPSCPFPPCFYHFHSMTAVKPVPCGQAQHRVPDGGLGGRRGAESVYSSRSPPAHSSTQKYPCSYQRFWS